MWIESWTVFSETISWWSVIMSNQSGIACSDDTNCLVGIKLNPALDNGQINIGLAAVDSNLNLVKVTEFKDKEIFSSLEAFLVQLGPSEVLLPQTENMLIKKISALVTRNSILVTERSSQDFSPLSQLETKKMISSKSKTDVLKTDTLASGALNAVFNYLNFAEDSSSKFSLESLNNNRSCPAPVKKKRVLPNWMLVNADTTTTVPVNNNKINRNPKRRILPRWVDQRKKNKDDGGRFSRSCK